MADRIGYVDPDKDLGEWVDGPADTHLRDLLLEAAGEKAASWAPKKRFGAQRAGSDAPPARYILAQVLLVKHLWARKQAGDGEGFGTDGYMIQTYPLVREAYDLMTTGKNPFAGLL